MSADTLCWTDIPVTNLDRATKFYSAVLGQEVSKMSEGGFEYGLLPHEEQNTSGCLCARTASAPRTRRRKPGRSFIFRWKDGSMTRSRPCAPIAEKSWKRKRKSDRTVFVR